MSELCNAYCIMRKLRRINKEKHHLIFVIENEVVFFFSALSSCFGASRIPQFLHQLHTNMDAFRERGALILDTKSGNQAE